jgi:hypothetical protein
MKNPAQDGINAAREEATSYQKQVKFAHKFCQDLEQYMIDGIDEFMPQEFDSFNEFIVGAVDGHLDETGLRPLNNNEYKYREALEDIKSLMADVEGMQEPLVKIEAILMKVLK